MDASTQGNLSSRLDAVIDEARGKIKAFQTEAEQAYEGAATRFQKFLPIAESITAMAKEKLERLRERLKFDVTPAHAQTERYYLRSIELDIKSELAPVIKLGFRLSHDADVRNIQLDYNLEILPVFFRFNSHARLDVPLDDYDEAAVSGWFDDRLVDFANAYLELHMTKQYQQRVLVPDTVAGISFPKNFAAATLEYEGTTYYFVSDETRREFEKRHKLTP